MSSSLKTVYKVFWAWQEDREAKWLQAMALSGWSLKSARGIRYTFERSAPQNVVYRLDFKGTFDDDLAGYLELYRDAGWEYVTRFGNWFYFRRPADAAVHTELYTDNASRLARYRAQLRVMLLAGLPLIMFAGGVYPLISRSYDSGWMRALHVVVLACAALYSVAVGRIILIVRRLETMPKE